jgi:hypothetical protein
MKKIALQCLPVLLLTTGSAKSQHICTQQFSNISISGNSAGITVADAEAIVKDILNVTGLKGNFEIRAAEIPNAAAVVYNGKRYVLYNPVFISALNNTTGNDWASVSVLAHEIGHHLNGHTLGGGSQPMRELEADEFSGYIMQRLGATLEEAKAAMKLAADIKVTTTHPERSVRLTAIEEGWNSASDQLAADIEANEEDSTRVTAIKKDSSSPQTKMAGTVIRQEDIVGEVHFNNDSASNYFILIDGSFVGVKNEHLFRLGTVKAYDTTEYPYIIESKNNRLYINRAGIIFDRNGAIVGRILKQNEPG